MKKLKTRDKVILLGSAPCRKDTPYSDESYDIWAIGGAPFWEDVKRFDVLFEMHKRHVWIDRAEGLNKCGKPVFMLRHFREIENSIPFPFDELSENGNGFYAGSISYMLALAIFLGYKEIALYGILMEHGTEYESQLPSASYYVGLAQGKGIKVYIHPDATICKSLEEYGYDDNAMVTHMLEQYDEVALVNIKKQEEVIQTMRDKLNQMKGVDIAAKELIAYIKRNGFRPNVVRDIAKGKE
jgi:hypothetical protein